MLKNLKVFRFFLIVDPARLTSILCIISVLYYIPKPHVKTSIFWIQQLNFFASSEYESISLPNMSEILHCGGDETTERQVNSESPQPQNELAADSQQYYPSIAAEHPGSELGPRHKQPLAAPILEVDILDLAETPGSTGSMEVNFDCEYDLEAYLEDFSRLARKGKFDSAKDLFESCPSDLKDHPEFVLDFVDTLLKQGAYKTLVGFAADKESSLLKQLSDCGKIPSQYLSSLFELGRQRAFGYLPDDKMKDVGADEVRSELLANFENLDSIQVSSFYCVLDLCLIIC